MYQRESALKKLSEGIFICGIRYPEEYAYLSEQEGARFAEEWLQSIGYRLARLGDEGAFFMAHSIVTVEMRAKIREDMKNVRSKLEPITGFLDTLRQSQGRNPQIHAGDMIWESEVVESVRNSTILENRLGEMKEIFGARSGESTQERVRKMLKDLESAGYLFESNPTNRGYRVTGKIEYLYQLIGFIATNSEGLLEEGLDDHIGKQVRIESAEGEQNSGLDVEPGEIVL